MMVLDYGFPNEFANPIVWDPVVFAYALLISGADLLILASLSFLSKRLTKAIPLLLVTGVAFFSVVLLGPLADIRQPQRATLLFTNPHLFAVPGSPGISLIALYGILWLVTFALGVSFLLLYFSYPMYLRAQEGGRLKPIYSLLSLGVKDEATYKKLQPILKVNAAVLLVPALMWGIYPSVLLLLQTWLFVWRSWVLLPVIFFVDTFVASTAAALLIYFLYRFRRMEKEVLNPLLTIHAMACISVAGLLSLQLMIWGLWLEGRPVLAAFDVVLPLIYAVMAAMVLSFLLALLSTRRPQFTFLVSLVALAGVLMNKWNTIVNGQLVSRTGLVVLELHLPANWVLTTMAPIAAAVALLIALSWIFPLEVKGVAQ